MSEPEKSVKGDPGLFFAKRFEGGYTWTLASRLGQMLRDVQEMFGPRDMSYTILGVEFVQDNPRIWYPGNCKHIVIQLHYSALANMSQACFQLAHESLHLISPTGGNYANIFEEGLAEYFSRHYMRTRMNQPNWRGTVPSYSRAADLISRHLNCYPDAVRQMRCVQPTLCEISAETLMTYFGELSKDDAAFLVQPFDRGA